MCSTRCSFSLVCFGSLPFSLFPVRFRFWCQIGSAVQCRSFGSGLVWFRFGSGSARIDYVALFRFESVRFVSFLVVLLCESTLGPFFFAFFFAFLPFFATSISLCVFSPCFSPTTASSGGSFLCVAAALVASISPPLLHVCPFFAPARFTGYVGSSARRTEPKAVLCSTLLFSVYRGLPDCNRTVLACHLSGSALFSSRVS